MIILSKIGCALRAFVKHIKIVKRHFKYKFHFKKLMRLQGVPDQKTMGEKEYVQFWKRLSPRVEPYSYRLFRNYCGDSPYIVPEDIGHSFIEPKLNPIRFTSFYEDKNVLPHLLPDGSMPRTLLCRMNGSLILNKDMNVAPIDEKAMPTEIFTYVRVHEIILKPSLDSSSGRRVMKFQNVGNRYVAVNDEKIVLDGAFLMHYGHDWVLQEAIKQHPVLDAFCSSSVNTIRVFTYRSVLDEQVYLTSASIRIGHQGSVVDNLHAGGGFVGIDIKTGKLMPEVLDQYGNRTDSINGINFAQNEFTIPNWKNVIDFAKMVASHNHHCRLIALDISITQEGTPKLIEWNVSPNSFSYWIPMMIGITPFGDKTEEILDYCINN